MTIHGRRRLVVALTTGVLVATAGGFGYLATHAPYPAAAQGAGTAADARTPLAH